MCSLFRIDSSTSCKQKADQFWIRETALRKHCNVSPSAARATRHATAWALCIPDTVTTHPGSPHSHTHGEHANEFSQECQSFLQLAVGPWWRYFNPNHRVHLRQIRMSFCYYKVLDNLKFWPDHSTRLNVKEPLKLRGKWMSRLNFRWIHPVLCRHFTNPQSY